MSTAVTNSPVTEPIDPWDLLTDADREYLLGPPRWTSTRTPVLRIGKRISNGATGATGGPGGKGNGTHRRVRSAEGERFTT